MQRLPRCILFCIFMPFTSPFCRKGRKNRRRALNNKPKHDMMQTKNKRRTLIGKDVRSMMLLIPLCLILAGIFLRKESQKKYVPAVALKGAASLCFVLLGVLCSSGTPLARLIVVGLVLGCAADVLLNLRMVFEKKGQTIFLVGILVFLSGHVLYLAAILPLCAHKSACFVIGAVLTALLNLGKENGLVKLSKTWFNRQLVA